MTTQQVELILAYIRRIRNIKKKTYAERYLLHLQNADDEPKLDGLSYMAGQAVRMEIDRIVGDTE